MSIRPKFRFAPKNDLEWGRFVDQATATPGTGEVTDDSFADRSGNSVIGRASNTSGKPADILLSSDQFLVNRGGTLTGGGLLLADLPAGAATDVEVAAAITAHEAAADPHPGYALETSGTFTGTLTDVTATVTGTLRYTKVGNAVVLQVPALSGTSNATAGTITGMPVAIRPARSQRLYQPVTDNGTTALGTVQVETSGVITLGVGLALGAFTNSGTKGVPAVVFSYSLD